MNRKTSVMHGPQTCCQSAVYGTRIACLTRFLYYVKSIEQHNLNLLSKVASFIADK